MLTEEQQYWIDQLTSDLCYERVKFSSLFHALKDNNLIDAKADELKAEVSKMIEAWIVKQEDEIEDQKAKAEELAEVLV